MCAIDHRLTMIKKRNLKLLHFSWFIDIWKGASCERNDLCATNNTNQYAQWFLLFLQRSKKHLHLTIRCEKRNEILSVCFFLEKLTEFHRHLIRPFRLKLLQACRYIDDVGRVIVEVVKRNDALLSSFLLPFILCSFHAFSPLRLLDHEHTIMIHWTTTTGKREKKVISGSIYLRREKKKERVTNDKTITIRLESVSWFLVRWWTLASHWWIIIKDETSQMGMVTVTLRREWTVDDWRENFLLFLLKWLL